MKFKLGGKNKNTYATITAENKDEKELLESMINIFSGEHAPKEEWPKEGDKVWIVDDEGLCLWFYWKDTARKNNQALQGIFRTEGEAKMEKLRRESRAKQKWVPRNGDWYRYWDMRLKSTESTWWTGNSQDISLWHMGNVHKTEKEAEEWGKTYGPAFEVPSEGVK